MLTIEDTLTEVERLLATVRVQGAEDLIRSLMYTMGGQELRVWEADLRRTIDLFFHKRRRELTQALDRRLSLSAVGADTKAPEVLVDVDTKEIQADLRAQFVELARLHIF